MEWSRGSNIESSAHRKLVVGTLMDSRRSLQIDRHDDTQGRRGNGAGDQGIATRFTAPALIRKLRKACDAMIAERGAFSLFAVLMPERESTGWDIVVCADWLKRSDKTSLDYIFGKLAGFLSRSEMTKIARVIVADTGHAAAEPLTETIITSKITRVMNIEFSGLQIRDGYIFESRPKIGATLSRLQKQRKRIVE